MRLTPYGTKEIVVSTLCLISTGIALFTVHPAAAFLPAVVLVWVLSFFRDPARTVPPGEERIVSPADGVVADVLETVEDRYLKQPCVRVGIFLSVFNVHVNRSPMSGRVVETRYSQGEFHHANSPLASRQNEANDLWLQNDSLDLGMVLRQISGQAARRIVCACKAQDTLQKGERFGMIKFGSRTELFIPSTRLESLQVRVGDRVRGGETVVAIVRSRENA